MHAEETHVKLEREEEEEAFGGNQSARVARAAPVHPLQPIVVEYWSFCMASRGESSEEVEEVGDVEEAREEEQSREEPQMAPREARSAAAHPLHAGWDPLLPL